MPRPKAQRKKLTKEDFTENREVMGRLMRFLFDRYKFRFILVFICIAISVLCNVQGTLFMQTLIDDYIEPMITTGSRDFGPLLAAILRVAGFYAAGVAATYIYNLTMVYISQGSLRALRDQLFEHMERLPIKYFDSNAHGDIMSTYTNDIDTLRQLISQSIPQIFNSTLTIVAVLISMIRLSLPLTGVTLVMVGVMLVVTGKIAGLSGKYFIKQQKDIATVNGNIEEMMNGQKVVKVFNHEEAAIEKFNELNEQLYESASKANTYANVLMPANAQIGNVSYVLIAVVGGILALNGWTGLTLGKLASFLTFNKSFNMPINQVSQQLNFIVMAMAGAKRIFAMIDEEPEVDTGYVTLVNAREEDGQIVECEERTGMWAWKHYHQADGTTTYQKQQGEVVFDDVDFAYVPEKTVLHNIKLYAEPGQKIAFVGATGAGKTTITNLINRISMGSNVRSSTFVDI